MKGRAIVGVVAVGLAAIGMVATAGAGSRLPAPKMQGASHAASKPTLAHKLRTTTAINQYLRARGVNPREVVIQRGKRNYAGPNCPGASWNCTTSRKVVQIARPGGENRVVLRLTAQDECQGAQDNNVHCKQDEGPAAVLDCDITQAGPGKNHAHVKQVIRQRDGGAQFAQETCRIRQVATGKHGNVLHVDQEIDQTTSEAVGSVLLTQDQEAEQLLDAEQQTALGDNHAHVRQRIRQDGNLRLDAGTASQTQRTTQYLIKDGDEGPGFAPVNFADGVRQYTDGGRNTAKVDQSLDQDLKSSGAGHITQDQNVVGGRFTPAPLAAAVTLFCDPGPPKFNTEANTCSDVEQDGTRNDLHVKQDARETETASDTPGNSVVQNQGAPSGGLANEFHQSGGPSNANSDQDHRLKAKAPPGSSGIRDIDPTCCGFSQTGSPDSKTHARQFGSIEADEGIFNATNGMFCESSGTCDTHSVLVVNAERSDIRCSSTAPGQTCFYSQSCSGAAGTEEDFLFCTPSQEVAPCDPEEDPYGCGFGEFALAFAPARSD